MLTKDLQGYVFNATFRLGEIPLLGVRSTQHLDLMCNGCNSDIRCAVHLETLVSA